MDALPKTLLATIIAIPFVSAALLFMLAIRAVMRGQLISKGRYMPARTIFRSAQPWFEILLYCLCGTFLLLMGLMWIGHDPRWFHQVLLGRPGTHTPRP